MSKSFLSSPKGHHSGAGDGTDGAFREFYLQTEPYVRRYVTRRLKSDVDELVESVFITAWQRADSVPTVFDDQLVWLYAIARRKIANFVRLKRRRDRFNINADIERSPSQDGQEESSASTLVHRALSQLSPSKREILLLVEWDGLTVEQAANVLGVTSTAAGKRLWAARNTFRSLCESQLDHLPR